MRYDFTRGPDEQPDLETQARAKIVEYNALVKRYEVMAAKVAAYQTQYPDLCEPYIEKLKPIEVEERDFDALFQSGVEQQAQQAVLLVKRAVEDIRGLLLDPRGYPERNGYTLSVSPARKAVNRLKRLGQAARPDRWINRVLKKNNSTRADQPANLGLSVNSEEVGIDEITGPANGVELVKRGFVEEAKSRSLMDAYSVAFASEMKVLSDKLRFETYLDEWKARSKQFATLIEAMKQPLNTNSPMKVDPLTWVKDGKVYTRHQLIVSLEKRYNSLVSSLSIEKFNRHALERVKQVCDDAQKPVDKRLCSMIDAYEKKFKELEDYVEKNKPDPELQAEVLALYQRYLSCVSERNNKLRDCEQAKLNAVSHVQIPGTELKTYFAPEAVVLLCMIDGFVRSHREVSGRHASLQALKEKFMKDIERVFFVPPQKRQFDAIDLRKPLPRCELLQHKSKLTAELAGCQQDLKQLSWVERELKAWDGGLTVLASYAVEFNSRVCSELLMRGYKLHAGGEMGFTSHDNRSAVMDIYILCDEFIQEKLLRMNESKFAVTALPGGMRHVPVGAFPAGMTMFGSPGRGARLQPAAGSPGGVVYRHPPTPSTPRSPAGSPSYYGGSPLHGASPQSRLSAGGSPPRRLDFR